MPRIRSVKPELFTHERLFEAESDYKLPLRLAFIALFTQCDQWGCDLTPKIRTRHYEHRFTNSNTSGAW